MNEKATTEIYDRWDVDVPNSIRNTLLKNKVYLPEDLRMASLGLKKGVKLEHVQKLKRDLGFDLLEPFNYYTWPVDVPSLIHKTLSDNNVGVPSDLEAAEIKITSGSKKHGDLLLNLRKSLGFSNVKHEQFRNDLPESLRNVRWKEVELKVSSRIGNILERYRLETFEDIASFLDLESVTCPETGKTHHVSEISNFGDSSFSQLKREIRQLCDLGLDGYRNDGLQKVNTAADLIDAISEKLKGREKEIFSSHEKGNALAKKHNVTPAYISLTKKRIKERITESEREKAREFLNRCWGPRGTRIAVPIDEAVAMAGAEHKNEVLLLREILNADCFWDEKAEVLFKVSKQRKREIEDQLNRIDSSEIQFNQDGIFNFQQSNGLEQEINREEFRFLLGAKRIAGKYKSQLSNELTGGRMPSSNGVDFALLQPSGLFSDANTLVAFLNDNLKKDFDVSPSGSIRGVTRHTNRSDEAVRVLKDAEGALTTQELKDRIRDLTDYDWTKEHLNNELNDRLESVLTGVGTYIHMENLGWTFGKVNVLGKWAEQKLLNKTELTAFEELFEEYKTAQDLPHVENAYQLASCARKHPKIGRDGSKEKLFHIESHERKQRWHSTNIREFVKDLRENIDSLDPSERQAIFANKGLSDTTGQHVEFLNDFRSGSLPREDIDDFVKGKDEASKADVATDTTEAPSTLVEKDNEEIGEVETEALTSSANGNDESDPISSLPSVSTTDALAAMDNKIVQSTDGETAEFLIEKAKAKIWRHAYIDEAQASEELRKYNTEGEYSQRVKREFQSEYDSAKSLVIPDGYSFQVDGKIAQPNLMQRHVASKVKQLRSGIGLVLEQEKLSLPFSQHE